ncbi:hypothetical protein THAOC_27261, partial [Thalassiosira oceanica]
AGSNLSPASSPSPQKCPPHGQRGPRRLSYVSGSILAQARVGTWNIISKDEARRPQGVGIDRHVAVGVRGRLVRLDAAALEFVDGSSASTRPSRWQVRRALAGDEGDGVV